VEIRKHHCFPLASGGASISRQFEATKLKQEQERTTRAGDPPTDRLRANWRERMEDMVWALVNSPEFVFVP
jgi:hypothetical protein